MTKGTQLANLQLSKGGLNEISGKRDTIHIIFNTNLFCPVVWQNPLPQGNSLNSVYFTDSNTGWAVGNYGTILKTTNGGITFAEEETDEKPTDNTLFQNYPNPFNPSTKIKYSVAQTSQVQIKVFDVLGNEIETLINEEKPAGTYELTWNASNLPSGIYFYQLRGGEFIQTKKMILLK